MHVVPKLAPRPDLHDYRRVARRKVTTTVYIEREQDDLLKMLSRRTRVPVAEYIRQGIDLVLSANHRFLPGQLTLFRQEGQPEPVPNLGAELVAAPLDEAAYRATLPRTERSDAEVEPEAGELAPPGLPAIKDRDRSR